MAEIKRRFSLLPVKALGLVLDVLTDGASKHGDAGWIDSTDTDYLDAMMRHLEAWRDGEHMSSHGFPHLAHVAARALLLLARSTIKNGGG